MDTGNVRWSPDYKSAPKNPPRTGEGMAPFVCDCGSIYVERFNRGPWRCMGCKKTVTKSVTSEQEQET